MSNSGEPLALSRGRGLLHNPRLNKGTAFTEAEREALGLVGLLPEGVDTEELQLQRVRLQLDQKNSDIERYIFLSSLQDTNETLCYKTLMSDPARFMPLVYTPTVGEACQKFGHIIRRPKSVYLAGWPASSGPRTSRSSSSQRCTDPNISRFSEKSIERRGTRCAAHVTIHGGKP
jgi:malate dehydrogenase (oxaloacetate-decarboxylating)(NADP+)